MTGKRLLIALFTAIVSATSAVAANYRVNFTVTDSIGEPEPYATVKLFLLPDTVTAKVTGVTNENGVFNREIKQPGDYRLMIYSVGKSPVTRNITLSDNKPVAELGTLILGQSDNVLNEVVVEAVRPIVSMEVDRIGYDVQADSESKTAMTDDILKKVPMVSVEADGTIKVNGSTDFKIYKNGKPNQSFSRNAKELFKSLPASMIERIEVITEPGAREDAEGVSNILNIVTVKNMMMTGAMGSVNANFNTRTRVPSPGAWVTAQLGKFMMSVNLGTGSWNKRSSKSKNLSETTYHDSGNTLTSESESYGKGRYFYGSLEASYEIDTLNLVTMEFSGFGNRQKYFNNGFNRMISSDGTLIYDYNTNTVQDPNNSVSFGGAANYQRSTRLKGETITLSYRVDHNRYSRNVLDEYEEIFSLPVPYTGIRRNSLEKFLEQTVQLDWSRPLSKIMNLDLGGKFINRDNRSNSTNDYIGYRTDISEFHHITNIGSLYADYRLNVGKFGARAGLRYEYSHLSAKYPNGSHDPFSANLNDFVPNVGLIFNPSRSHSIKYNFGSRIQRPGINYLDPTVNAGPTSTSQGNPNLESVRINSMSLQYSLMQPKVNLNLTANYNFSTNGIISVMNVVDDHTYSTYANAGHNRSFSLSAYANWRPTTKTSFMINLNERYSFEKNPSANIHHGTWMHMVYFRYGQTLPWKLEFSTMMNFFRFGGGLYSKIDNDFFDTFYYTFNLRRQFLKDNRLSVGLYLTNPITNAHPTSKYHSVNLPYTSYSTSWSTSNRSFSISVSYRFGQLRASVKKVKGISNDDMVGGNSASQGASGGAQ